MKWRALFFIVMIATGSVQVSVLEARILLSSKEYTALVVVENPLFQHKDSMGLSNATLGTLVFLGLGLMLVPVIRRSILAKLLV